MAWQAAKDEDLAEGFATWLLEKPERVQDLELAPTGSLFSYFDRAFARFHYERDLGTPLGKFRKAIDTVVRLSGFTVASDGRIESIQSGGVDTGWPESLWGPGGDRFDHWALKAAVNAALAERGPSNRTQLARRILKRYGQGLVMGMKRDETGTLLDPVATFDGLSGLRRASVERLAAGIVARFDAPERAVLRGYLRSESVAETSHRLFMSRKQVETTREKFKAELDSALGARAATSDPTQESLAQRILEAIIRLDESVASPAKV